jgi:hypothetical protein
LLSLFLGMFSHFLTMPGWTQILLFTIPHSWDVKCRPPHPVYWLRCDLANFFPGLAKNHQSPNLNLLCSWDYRLFPKLWRGLS